MEIKISAEVLKARIQSLLNMLADEPNLQEPRFTSVIQNSYLGAMSVFEAVYGAKSVQVQALQDAQKMTSGTTLSHQRYLFALRIKGALQNLSQEIDLGLVGTLAKQTAGEVLGDFLALAKAARQDGYASVAAVLAVAALEDGLKRIAEGQGINTNNKTMDSVINSLKAVGFFKGAQASIISSYVKLRNLAMHADWDKIKDADIGGLIGFLESFLLENFS